MGLSIRLPPTLNHLDFDVPFAIAIAIAQRKLTLKDIFALSKGKHYYNSDFLKKPSENDITPAESKVIQTKESQKSNVPFTLTDSKH